MPSNPTCFQSPCGSLNLTRYPSYTGETLLAWCSADVLLLEYVKRHDLTGATVVVNDTYGALCIALQPQALWTDSALAVLALRDNERANSRLQTPIVLSTETPAVVPELVIMRVPKQRTYFEYQLSRIAAWLPPGGILLAAGMDKHLSPHTAQILERYIGTTQRLPGERKARLFRAVKEGRVSEDSPTQVAYQVEELNTPLQGLPNVFSREKLDIGTRFLVEHMNRLEPVDTAMDLACGNGVLGLIAMQRGLAQKLVFCDESALAIASAQLNARTLFPGAVDQFHFHHGDGVESYSGERAQLILCNPPFHQEHTVNEFVGRRLLEQAARHLGPGGTLFIVANRHLDYRSVFRSNFSQVEKCAANAKFNIFRARKD